jgi:hypothetical protein
MKFLDWIIRIVFQNGFKGFKMNIIKTLLKFKNLDMNLRNNLESSLSNTKIEKWAISSNKMIKFQKLVLGRLKNTWLNYSNKY